jgi:hypothetical protein
MSAQEETSSNIEVPVTQPTGDVSLPNQPGADDVAAQGSDRDDKGRFRNPVQPRIDELTRKARDNEREAAYWRTRAEAAEKPKEVAAPVKPTPETFDDYGAYVEALADWKADEKVSKALEARDAKAAERQALEQRQSTWAERAAAARARLPDFDQVMSTSDVPIADFVSDALRESERGPELAHAIAKDPSIADRLNAMSPQRAAIELGRMEARLPEVSASPDPEEVPDVRTPVAPAAPVRKTTSAPPPVKPIAKGASTTVNLSKAGMDEYVKQRTAEGARWARR